MSAPHPVDKPRSSRIQRVEITDDTLTDRAGLALFVSYLEGLPWLELLADKLKHLRRSRKRPPIIEILLQFACFLLNAGSRHLTWFDQCRADPGYAAVIGRSLEQLLSSHAVKRFLYAFSYFGAKPLRDFLGQIFVWRLHVTKPNLLVLHLDAMVMDNDDAEKRHGVQPTYKKVKGFAPLQLCWERLMVDAVFRGGAKHSNHGDSAYTMLSYVISRIRTQYSATIPILFLMDSAFFDETLFNLLENEPGVGYICAGKRYVDILNRFANVAAADLEVYENHRCCFGYAEFMEQRATWFHARRALYLRQLADHGQGLLPLDETTERVIVTNLGQSPSLDQALRESGHGHLLEPRDIIRLDHSRGAGELTWRHLKEFRDQRLPCKSFPANLAFYFITLIVYNLYECFKEDVLDGTLDSASYPNTIRRQVLDTAGKIVHHAGNVVLKVTRATWQRLNFGHLWHRAHAPPSLHLLPATG